MGMSVFKCRVVSIREEEDYQLRERMIEEEVKNRGSVEPYSKELMEEVYKQIPMTLQIWADIVMMTEDGRGAGNLRLPAKDLTVGQEFYLGEVEKPASSQSGSNYDQSRFLNHYGAVGAVPTPRNW
jgi:hypothetical protein